MKIKLTQGMAGNKFVGRPGEIHDFPEVAALRLIERGMAVRVDETPEPSALDSMGALKALAQDDFETAMDRPRGKGKK